MKYITLISSLAIVLLSQTIAYAHIIDNTNKPLLNAVLENINHFLFGIHHPILLATILLITIYYFWCKVIIK